MSLYSSSPTRRRAVVRLSGRDDDGSSPGEMRTTLDRAGSGAPAAGYAVRDLFSTDEIFQRLVATADEEFVRSTRLLFLSGLAAGLSIGLSFLARSAVTAAAGPSLGDGAVLVGNILYPIGFLLIVLGRYQLFTENTLTPVTLVLTRIASVPELLRLWGIVLAANVVGAALVALVLAKTGVLDADTAAVAQGFGQHALEVAWGPLFWKGVIAGWLVASMVWLNLAARDTITRFFVVLFIMYLVPSLDLYHCVIGACEMAYLIFLGQASIGAGFYFFSAVVLGNTVGGVLLVAILNYAQTRERRFPDRDCGDLALTWREFLFGLQPGEGDAQAAGPSDRVVEEESMLDRPIPTEDPPPHG